MSIHFYVLVVSVCMCVYLTAMGHVWKSEDNCQFSFAFYHVGPGDGTQIVRLARYHLYLKRHVALPIT